jgi:two-component system, NtrC family, C4-dicarboxylate transport response regulator DctD
MTQGMVFFVDDDAMMRSSTQQSLELAGFTVRSFASAKEVLGLAGPGMNGVILSDIRMPEMDGMTLLQCCRDLDMDLPVILMTGHADVQLAVEAMRRGAYDFIEKPFSPQDLAQVLRRALELRGLVLDNRRLRAAVGKDDDLETRMAGRSAAVISLRKQVRAIGAAQADVLIMGPTGAGKEVVARALHDLSPRGAKPFVAVNCAGLPGATIESELFGHEAGAFSGAMRARFGRFEHARGGTILLDEVGQMPLDAQAKLLRVLQERVITRLGSNEPIPLDVRFMATSTTDLAQDVAQGRFREDLYWRLNVVTLHIPPLAARREDIPLLFLQLAREAGARHRVPDRLPTPELLADLAGRDWPGNVRELRNAADRFVLGLDWMEQRPDDDTGPDLAQRVASFERAAIAGAIAAHGGHLRRVYESLGISRKTLYEKMQKHGLSRPDGATGPKG